MYEDHYLIIHSSNPAFVYDGCLYVKIEEKLGGLNCVGKLYKACLYPFEYFIMTPMGFMYGFDTIEDLGEDLKLNQRPYIVYKRIT